MTSDQKKAYEWAKNQNYPSVAARYAKELARLVDELQAAPCARQEQDSNDPLTLDELRSRVCSWVWVVVNYENCKCAGWALIPTPAFVAFLDQTIPIDFYGKKFVAYDHKPEDTDHA